jgi:ribosomal protein S6--L-glutamate ligase
LRFAVLTAYPQEDWHSERIVNSLRRHGEVQVVDPAELSAEIGRAGLEVRIGNVEASSFDGFVLARGLSPRGNGDAQFSLYQALEEEGALVVNRIGALLDAQDKFRSSLLLKRAGVRTPRAALAQSAEAARRFAGSGTEVVIKPLAGSLGEGVERLPAGPEGERLVAERTAAEGAIYLQEWVPNPGRDMRVFVVGGRAVGAVERCAAPGEFRANVAQGATPRPARMLPETARCAERAAVALGLDYTGIDLIETPLGPEVIEVNGNPSFDMFFEAMGVDMSEEIARHVAERAVQHGARRALEESRQGRQALER